jgi:hypothetical protein
MKEGKGEFMKVRILFFLFIGFALALNLSCKKRESFKADPNAAAAKLAELGEITGLEFPEGSAIEEYEYQPGLDDILFLKVTIPESQIERFLEGSGFYAGTVMHSEAEKEPRQILAGPKRWERELEQVRKWKASKVRLPNRESLTILVDTGGKEESYMVYLVWFET